MINKKGIGFYTLAVLLILLAILLIFLPFTSTLVAMLKKGGDIEACRLSVLAQAQTKLGGSSPVSLKCDRRQVKFYNNKIEINGKKDPKYDFKQLDSSVVNKAVAEELRLCWYMMGEGELNVFQQQLSEATIVAFTGENVCNICSEISFDKSVDRTKQFTGLVDYLKGNKIPNQDAYYFDYLIKSQRNKYLLWGIVPWTQYTPWSWGTTDKISDNLEEDLKKYQEAGTYTEFNPDERYIIYFLAWKPSWLKEKLHSSTSAYYIGLASPGKVVSGCRMLVN